MFHNEYKLKINDIQYLHSFFVLTGNQKFQTRHYCFTFKDQNLHIHSGHLGCL